MQISSFSALKKFNEKVCFRRKFTPYHRISCCLHTMSNAVLEQNRTHLLENDTLYTPIPIVLHHKTTTLALQNDRNCLPKRPLLHRDSLRFIAHTLSKLRNSHAINRLQLHTHTAQKTDRRFYFSFFGYSQSLNNANIVHPPLSIRHIETLHDDHTTNHIIIY